MFCYYLILTFTPVPFPDPMPVVAFLELGFIRAARTIINQNKSQNKDNILNTKL